MGSFANTLFTILLGWMQGAVSAVWSAFTSEKGSSFLTWIGDHWIVLAGILCLIGLAADLCVYLMRWKPMKVWKSFLFRGRDEREEPETRKGTAAAPKAYQRTFSPRNDTPEPVTAPKERYETPDLSQWEEEPAPVRRERAEIPEEPALVTGAGYVVPADSPYRRPAAQPEYIPQQNAEKAETPVYSRRRTTEDADSPRSGRRNPPEPEAYAEAAPAETAESIRHTDAVPEGISRRDMNEREERRTIRDDRYEQEAVYRPEETTEPAPVKNKRRRRLNVSDLFANPEEELREIDAPQDVIDRRKAYREPVYPRGWKQNEEDRHE